MFTLSLKASGVIARILASLHTKHDWIEAGKLVFDYDIGFFPFTGDPPAAEEVKSPDSVSKEGILLPSVSGFR